MAETNFYKILGLGRSASAEQIKVAYRKLVKKHHPDLFSGTSGKAKATEKLRLINEAYAVLGNPERRQRYDKEFAQKPPPRPRTPGAAARGKTPPPPHALSGLMCDPRRSRYQRCGCVFLRGRRDTH